MSCMSSHVQSAPGDLDTTFGTSGTVKTNISRYDFATSCTVQSDDAIIIVGSANGYSERVGALRYTANGTIDTTFNSTGNNKISIGSQASGYSVALQADDKIVISGYGSPSSTDVAVVRLDTDGTLDTTFDSDGIVTTAIGYGSTAYSVAVQSDDYIVVGGLGYQSQAEFALARYDSTGALDTTGFGTSGIVTTAIGYEAIIHQIALQSDGKIVAGGYQWDPFIGTTFCLARYETDGTLDTGFGVDGIVTTTIGNEAKIYSIAIQDDGYIVAGGYTVDTDNITKFALARYDTTGALDTTGFGTSGIVITEIQFEAKINSIALQADGKIIAGGYSYGELANEFTLARYNTDGTIDTGFGDNGVTLTTIGGHNSNSRINALAFQSDGSVIAAGYSNDSFALARYLTA